MDKLHVMLCYVQYICGQVSSAIRNLCVVVIGSKSRTNVENILKITGVTSALLIMISLFYSLSSFFLCWNKIWFSAHWLSNCRCCFKERKLKLSRSFWTLTPSHVHLRTQTSNI